MTAVDECYIEFVIKDINGNNLLCQQGIIGRHIGIRKKNRLVVADSRNCDQSVRDSEVLQMKSKNETLLENL